MKGAKRNGDHCTGQTDDVIRHTEVRGGERDQQSLRVKSQEKRPWTVRKTESRKNVCTLIKIDSWISMHGIYYCNRFFNNRPRGHIAHLSHIG
jgi:hypothetical protein